MKKVSIIIPNYNNEGNIRECLESVLKQDYPVKEIIVVDDSSTDNSLQIIRGYVKNNACMKLYTSNHVGPNGARKLGLEKSTGEYIMFVDSDDFLKAGAVKILVDKIEKYDVDVVRSEAVRYPSGKKVAPILDDGEKEKIINHDDIAKLLSTGFKLTSLWAKLYRRKAINDLSAFEMDVNFGEDLLINMEALGRLDKILIIPDISYYYRDTIEGSMTHSFEKERIIKNITDRFIVSSKMLKFINKNIKSRDLKEEAIYEQFKAIWETMGRLFEIDGYTKKNFLNDFGKVFSNDEFFDVDLDVLKKCVKNKDIKEQIKNGKAVLAIAKNDGDGIWTNFLRYKRLKKILRRGK